MTAQGGTAEGRAAVRPVRAAPAAEREVSIRWRDMDAFGHVNNAVYLTYVEEAHDEFLRVTVGEGDGSAHVVVARVEIDFLAPLTQDDRYVTARCRLESLGTSSIVTSEELVAADGRVAARARSVMVKVDRATGRAVPLSEREREALGEEPAEAVPRGR